MIDIGLQAHGYTNGCFPLTQITELPSLSNLATQMGCTLQTLYEDTYMLFMYGAEPGALYTTNKLLVVSVLLLLY